MTDWWNDPPESDDPLNCPACSSGFGDYLTGNERVQMFACEECGHRWIIQITPDYGPEDIALFDDDEHPRIDTQPLCPHGQEWGECATCDYLGDLAYDAARERR
jgi:DNA-directed RNA polymerase subunit RPC12/RpoP